MSENTYSGKSEGLATGTNTIDGSKSEEESGAGAAVAGGVVVVGTLATVGYLFYAKKACFAAKSAGANVPTNPPTGANANMQSAV